MSMFDESVVEQAALDWLRGLGYAVISGDDAAPSPTSMLRTAFSEVVLAGVLRSMVGEINAGLPPESIDDAIRRVLRPEGASLAEHL